MIKRHRSQRMPESVIPKIREMMLRVIIYATIKWLRRILLAFMLGFSNAINQETKMMDDTKARTEQPGK